MKSSNNTSSRATKSRIKDLHEYFKISCPQTKYINNISFVNRQSLGKIFNSNQEKIKTIGLICPAHTYEGSGTSFESFDQTYQNKFYALTEAINLLQNHFALDLEFVFADLGLTAPKGIAIDQHIEIIDKQKEVYHNMLKENFSDFSYTSFQEQGIKIPKYHDTSEHTNYIAADIETHSKYLADNYKNAFIIKDGITDTHKKPYLEGNFCVQLFNCFVDIRTLPRARIKNL